MFSFDDKTSPSVLMDELERFIVFWMGPRRPEYGEPEATLAECRLPEPLRRLYSFAGRWPPKNGIYNHVGFGVEDYLLHASSIPRTDDDKVIFLGESQGIWRCATESHGDDPPVWCDADWLAQSNDSQKWTQVSNSLARFLVTFCLHDLLLSSQFRSTDAALVARFKSDRQDTTPLLTTGVYVSDELVHNYYLYRDHILVEESGDWIVFSSNQAESIALLAASQSPIVALHFYLHTSWQLDIDRDGSAEIRSLSTTSPAAICVPAGTFHFDKLIPAVQSACLSCDRESIARYFERPDAEMIQIIMPRQGEPAPWQHLFIDDWKLVKQLFDQALEHAATDELFDRQMAERPPFA